MTLNIPITPRLLEYRVPHDRDMPSLTVGYSGWTGTHDSIDHFWTSSHDGIHLIGNGNTMDPGGAETTLVLSRECGYVKIENFVIKAGTRRAILAGIDALNRDDSLPFALHLKGCTIEADQHTMWGIHSYGCDVVLEDCEIYLEASHEHGLYTHGFSRFGARVINSRIHAVGGEGLKFTARPRTEFYPEGFNLAWAEHHEVDGMHPTPGGSIEVRNTTIRNWHQPHSYRGGAGMTVQGAGLPVIVDNCEFVARQGDFKPAFAMDDSGWEHFSPEGVGGQSPANGHVVLTNSLFVTSGPDMGPWPRWEPVIRINHINSSGPGTGDVARSVQMYGCGVYGPTTRVEIGQMPQGRVSVRDCNTPEVLELARGILGSEDPRLLESYLNFNGSFYPMSQGV